MSFYLIYIYDTRNAYTLCRPFVHTHLRLPDVRWAYHIVKDVSRKLSPALSQRLVRLMFPGMRKAISRSVLRNFIILASVVGSHRGVSSAWRGRWNRVGKPQARSAALVILIKFRVSRSAGPLRTVSEDVCVKRVRRGRIVPTDRYRKRWR